MEISCETCPARGLRCGDCMMSVFIHPVFRTPQQPQRQALDAEDLRVLGMLTRSGLVNPHDARQARAESARYNGVRAVS